MKKGFIFGLALFIAIFLPGTGQVWAAITNPYTVDEKLQVIFGDSVPISTASSTYFGLENYAVDYVGGYAHITFTYTHIGLDQSCCYASYPPSVYVTASNPRATSTPIVKALSVPYVLLPRPIPPGHETDWYLYDLQFDATGYNALVKQRGEIETANFHIGVPALEESDWVALANQYPQAEPPLTTSNSMSFTPVPLRSGEPPIAHDPIIIIPGIMGSAYKNGKLVIDPILHTYDDLIATLDQNGYTPGTDLFTFPYEWRDSNVFSANLLNGKIEQVKQICDCDKVDLVAHSMGGLVARAYIQSGDYDQDVNQVIFLGVPHKGAPTSYLQWESGEFSPDVNVADILIGSFFEAEALRNGYSTIFNYIHGRPILSVQELLPTFNYLKDKSTGIVRAYPSNYPRNIFLENLNNNTQSLLSSGVEVTNIIGDSGENKTVNIIRVVPTDNQTFWQHGKPEGFGTLIGDNGLERGFGDNTVTPSGSNLSGVNSEEMNASHRRIPTLAENRIIKILTGKDSETSIDNGTNLEPKVLMLQLLSPIDVLITAPDGKKIGKDFANGSEFNEIPSAFYSGFETDNEYVTILNPLSGEYKVEVQGTGNGGKYGILTSYISDETATSTETTGLIAPGQVTTLNVNINDVSPEKIVTSEVLLNDIIKSYDLGWITDKKLKDNLVNKANAIIKVEKKIETVPDGKNKQKKIERLETKIDKKAAKALLVELKGYGKGKINQQAYDIIKADLEWLVNN